MRRRQVRKLMTDFNPINPQPGQPSVYQIKVKGHLGCQWANWFENMTIQQEASGDTTFTGPVIDQAALHGLLTKVRNLGLPLLSITRIDADNSDP